MKKSFKNFFVNSFFTYLAIELVEEMVEDLIAIGISSILTKAVSTLFVVSVTQAFKVSIKAVVKRYTYKEGNDKVEKIKTFFKWLYANKKTLIGTISTSVLVASGTQIIDVSVLPELLVGPVNITSIIYYAALGILSLIGVFGKGPEEIKEFFERVGLIKAEKEQKAIDKVAEKEIATEEKNAKLTQAEKEKQEAKALEEQQKAEEKAKAEAEYKAKVAEAKARILAERQSVSIDETQQ